MAAGAFRFGGAEVLTITKLTDAEYLLSQVALGIDDYYMGVGEAPGVWQGRLVDQLSLSGVVEADELRALLLGRDPGTDVELLAGRPERRVSAFDVTFSTPKSVSLLWAFASPEVSSGASIAHVESVAVALEFLERRAGATRQQVDGERQRVPAGVAAATFVHRTSREGDPQLHTHCVVANLGRRPDGSFAALDAAPPYEWGKAAEGPCLDAVSEGRPVLVADIGRGSEQRWPAFAESVLDAGVQAVFALPTAIAATPIGMLDLFRKSPGPLSADDLTGGLLAAELAALPLLDLMSSDVDWEVYG